MAKATKKLTILLMALLVWGLFSVPVPAAAIKDSESATHGSDASAVSIVDTYPFTGFKVIQLELPVLSTYSYMLISEGEALVVDPIRDIFKYLEVATREKVTIKGVYLTHSHADFVAGHLEMVKALNCPIYQSKKSGAQYKFHPLGDGDTVTIGKARLTFMETPGHTPDGMCVLAYGTDNPDVPQMMFTGDVLFVGSVGRPDLLEGTLSAAWLAGAVFDSWTQRISKLGDGVKIFPAHGAGSLCGAHLSDEPSSTIGKEKTANPYFKYTKRGEFIAALLDGLPEAPQYFKHNARLNRSGPPLVNYSAPLPVEVAPHQELMDPAKYYIVDLRDASDYAAGHIPNAVNIALRGRMETWTGIIVPWGVKLVLAGNRQELKEALFRFHRIGYTAEILTLEAWRKAGLPVSSKPAMKPAELLDQMQKGTAPIIIDVRLPSEWMALRIGKVLNLPLNRLAELASQLDPAEPVVAVCNSAYRSSMAVGILERKGFKHPMSLDGGSEAWIKAGYQVFETVKGDAAPTSTPKKYIKLAERISAADLRRLLMDLPGTFDLVDIRPAAHYKDYSLPGARNVDMAELLSNPSYLVGPTPLIIVDRDGSIASMIGGILSQKTERPIKVLYGGLDVYWSGGEKGSGTIVPTLPLTKTPAADLQPSAPAAPLPASPAKPADIPQPKRKSAGC